VRQLPPEAALFQDFRLAIRSLRATPVVTAVAFLSLALGIGANTAIFSLVNGLLLRSLPVKDPHRLVMLSTGQGMTGQYGYATFEQIRRHGEAFDGALAWSLGGKSVLIYGDAPETVEHHFVSGDYFSTLGVSPLLGRGITVADDVDGGGPDGPVIVISYGLWQRRFGGAASVVGAQVIVDRTPATIVGVTPSNFFGPVVGSGFDIVVPIKLQPLLQPATPLTDEMGWLTIMLRMKPGQSVDAATAALRAVQPQIRAGALPKDIQEARSFLKQPFTLSPVGNGLSPLRNRFERPLIVILVVAALVLVIALREHRQPAARSGSRAPARVERAGRAGRLALGPDASTPHGERRARVNRRGRGRRFRRMGKSSHRVPVIDFGNARGARPNAGLACPHVHGGDDGHDGGSCWRRAGASGHTCPSDRGVEGTGPFSRRCGGRPFC
jgi:hypothetical protein